MNKTSLTTAALALGILGAAFADIPVPEDTFLSPGLLQGRLPGQANFTDPIASSDTALRRELGPAMGLITDKGGYLFNNPTWYTSPIDGVKTCWTNDVTFAYAGRIFLDASKLYVFGARIDDSAFIAIDGATVISYANGGGCHIAAYAPSRTGWHDIEIRCGNGGGWAGANPYCNLGKIGFAYFTVDAGSADAATYATHRTDSCDDIDASLWQPLIDDGTGALFGTSPTTGLLDAVKVQYIGVHEGSLYVTVLPEIKEEVNVWIWYGPDYGGTNRNSWGTELWVGKTDGSGTMSVSGSYGLPAGTRYVRFVATGYYDGTHKWAGSTCDVADIPEADFDPQFTCSRDASTATPFSVDMVVDVSYPGFGATDWTATLVYGPGEKDTATASGSGAGQQRIHLENLIGGYSYLGTLTVTTDADRSVTLSNVDVSAAGEPALGLMPGLLQGKLAGSRNLEDGLEASTTDVRRELGPVMGLYTDTSGGSMPYTSEIDGVKSYWENNVTYLYQGQIYLDADKTYAFGARNDDSLDLWIDGQQVLATTGCARTTHAPSYTGWHSIEIRSGNGAGWAGANPYCPIGYKGIVYNDEGRTDHNCQNTHEDEEWWIPLKDTGDASLLGTPGQTATSDGITILSAEKRPGGATVRLVLKVEDSVTVYAWSGATYGGADAEAWDATSAALASKAVAEGDKTVRVTAPLSAGAEYLRFIAVSDRDPSIVWTSPTVPVAGLPETPGTIVFIR